MTARVDFDPLCSWFPVLLQKVSDSGETVGEPRFYRSQGNIENCSRLLQRKMLFVVQQQRGPARRRYAIDQLEKVAVELFVFGGPVYGHCAYQLGVVLQLPPPFFAFQISEC